MAEQFTSQQIVELTGVTLRQLQWWDEHGLVVPSRSGRNRLYSIDDLAEIAVIRELRSRGLSLQRVRKAVRFLQRELGKRLVETVISGADWHLLTDGRQIFLKNSAEQVLEVLKNSRQPMFAICLSDTVRQVRAEVHGAAVASASPARGGGPLEPAGSRAGVTGPTPSLLPRRGARSRTQAKPDRTQRSKNQPVLRRRAS